MVKKSTYVASSRCVNERVILERHHIKVLIIFLRILFHASLERLGVYDLAHVLD